MQKQKLLVQLDQSFFAVSHAIKFGIFKRNYRKRATPPGEVAPRVREMKAFIMPKKSIGISQENFRKKWVAPKAKPPADGK
jgi:hypothetical protein